MLQKVADRRPASHLQHEHPGGTFLPGVGVVNGEDDPDQLGGDDADLDPMGPSDLDLSRVHRFDGPRSLGQAGPDAHAGPSQTDPGGDDPVPIHPNRSEPLSSQRPGRPGRSGPPARR